MSASTITAIIVAACAVATMTGGLLFNTFKLGVLAGKIDAGQRSNEQRHAETLVRLGRMDGRLDDHLQAHTGVK